MKITEKNIARLIKCVLRSEDFKSWVENLRSVQSTVTDSENSYKKLMIVIT